jgi:pyruvate,water dikinase
MLLFDWATAVAAGPARAGGKGWNLGRLHRYGFPVPAGGVVSSEAYQQFMRHPDLQEALHGLDRLTAAEAAALGTTATRDADTTQGTAAQDAAARLERLRAAILATPLPPALAGELHAFLIEAGLLHIPVAVRSSASAEDSATASFAGIHQSFLNVTGLPAVVDALRGCYASLWTPQALAYRRRLGLPDESVAAAVVILAMVPARAAGVCFTCDPRTGRRDWFAVSASPGLGEAVVSGATEPDEYLVSLQEYPPRIMSRQIGRKIRVSVALPAGGTALQDATAEEAALPALTDAQVQELALLAGRVQDALGHMDQPQDIEWAHDGEQFWLVQARPVTTLPAPTFAPVADQPVCWSNANLRDVMPGVVSELNWSFVRAGMDTLLAAPLRAGAYDYEGGMTWVRLFEGRAYFNISAMQWAYYDALGMTPREFNQVLGGHQPELDLPPSTLAQRGARSLRRLRMIAATLATLRQAPAIFERWRAWADEAERQPYDTWSDRQLLDQSLKMKAVMEEYMPQFQLINSGAGGTHSELIKVLTPLFGDRAPGLVNAMLAGAADLTSAEQGERLIQLGNLALEEEAARAWFSGDPWDPKAWADALEGTRFKARFAEYLRDFGHRGVYEVEAMNPRWQEDPTYLLETVRSQVLSGRTIQLADQRAKREAARREVFTKLGVGPRAWQARYYLNQTAAASAHREMGKSILVKLIGVTRYLSLAVGRRMAAAGLIESPDDVFHLTWLDLEAFLTGRPEVRGLRGGGGALSGGEGEGSGLRHLVADRKALRQENLQKEPPDVIVGETPVKKAPPPAVTGAVLTGTGVASGRAGGPARVIRHPEEGARLQPGDVLVAPSTDPAWTPLFLRASAVVMEVGGYLSHGAIVAREYGLPAVANIPGLLQTVRDGEALTVDGDAGKVYREE